MNNELELVSEKDTQHIDGLKRLDAPSVFQTLETKVLALKTTAETINVEDGKDKGAIVLARVTRLAIREIRIQGEHRHKELKADVLKRGNEIDKFKRDLIALCEPIEQQLLEKEQFAERQEAARKAALKKEREELLVQYEVNTAFYDLSGMPEEAFQDLLDSTRIVHHQKKDAAERAERERLEAEEAKRKKETEEAADRERILAENEQMKKEAQERELAAQKEREKADEEKSQHEATVRKEREAREKIERENREREERETAAKRADEEAQLARAKAPDREKLLSVSETLSKLQLPTMETEAGKAAKNALEANIQKICVWIEQKAQNL